MLATKEDIRRGFPRNFLPPGVELQSLLDDEVVELEYTAGTSGQRIPLLMARGWWAVQERRALRLNPKIARVLEEFPAARRVTICSPVCGGDIVYTGVPSRAERMIGNALFVNLSRFPFLWSEADLARMAAESSDWAPQFLDVDPVYGAAFARYCERQAIRFPSLRFILSTYEFLSVIHRRILERVFRVPVFDLHGSTETGHLLMETELGRLTPSCETATLEVLAPDQQGVGELVVTTRTNEFMPLIRYRIGDLVETFDDSGVATYLVHGRVADAFRISPAQRLITTRLVDQCFSGLDGFAHYQLYQLPDGEWRLRYVADSAPPRTADLQTLRSRVEALLGVTGNLGIQATDLLMPEGSGKFRLGYPALKSGV